MARIMVVDDNSDVRNVISMLLKSKGHEVVEAENGKGCLENLKADNEIPDLIILDIMMPGMDGWEVSKSIKSNSRLRGMPVCILTAKQGRMDWRMSLEYGYADRHLTKPISKKELLKTTDQLIKRDLLKMDRLSGTRKKINKDDLDFNKSLKKHFYDFL